MQKHAQVLSKLSNYKQHILKLSKFSTIRKSAALMFLRLKFYDAPVLLEYYLKQYISRTD
ncbi:hypothetical protein BSR28_06370 [Boudabousia liubingyangii]|nr:hypothetical protein BSR28_06370 [Boudabousia liubingyangii]